MTQLAHTYRYPFASHVEPGWGLRLATSGSRADLEEHPYFFRGRLLAPAELADLLLVLSEVVRSRFYLPGAMRELDPVVTCSEHQMRFEGFSSCCGLYARADFGEEAFGEALVGRGTTNVDFNSAMRGALGRLRHGEEARLAVGAEQLELETESGTAVEKKVRLPVRWIKGFTEVQSYLRGLELVHEIEGSRALRFLRSLPRGGAPKRPSFVTGFRGGLRLSPRSSEDGVRVLGTDRLRLLEPLASRSRSMRVWRHEPSAVSAWELIFATGRFWLAVSPDLDRGFSGEGQALTELADPAWQGVLSRVRAELRWQSAIDPGAVAGRIGIGERELLAALAVLGARGLVGFDPQEGRYFHRELPFDLDRIEALNPRLRAARRLVGSEGVRWRKEGSEAMVRGSGVEHRVRLSADGDRCTCRWFSRHQGQRGPCKHILAARMVKDGREGD